MILRCFAPSDAELEAVRTAARREDLSYVRAPGAIPPGYTPQSDEERVGSGEHVWDAAVRAVFAWAMFDQSWLNMPARPEPDVGVDVVFASRQLGLWAVNACRIVERIDERSERTWRRGFAYGTLATHVVSGEEAFIVRWDRVTDEVWFGIHKFSRPNHPLVSAAGPLPRWLQARFSRQAIAAVIARTASVEAR